MAGKPMFDTEGSWGISTNLDPNSQPDAYTPPPGASQHWDIAGNSMPSGAPITADGSPVLVES